MILRLAGFDLEINEVLTEIPGPTILVNNDRLGRLRHHRERADFNF